MREHPTHYGLWPNEGHAVAGLRILAAVRVAAPAAKHYLVLNISNASRPCHGEYAHKQGTRTVPKKIRAYLGLRPGSAVRFSLGPHGEVILQPVQKAEPAARQGRFEHLRGTLDTGKVIDELMQVLRDYDADVHDPGLQ